MVAAILNLGVALGRPFIGYLSHRLGRVEVARVATFSWGILVFALWLPSTNYGVLVTFASVSGAILEVLFLSPNIGWHIVFVGKSTHVRVVEGTKKEKHGVLHHFITQYLRVAILRSMNERVINKSSAALMSVQQ